MNTLKGIKKILVLIIGLFLVSLISGAPGTYQQNTDINLLQTCDNCTYIYITSIVLGNKTVINFDELMTQDGTVYNWTFNSGYTSSTGVYVINGYGDDSGIDTIWTYNIEVTPTGTIQNSVLDNPVLIILISLSLIFLGLGVGFKIASLGFIGSILLILSGIYTMVYGFNNVTNLYTRGVAIALLGLGIIFMIVSAYEWLPWGKD